MSRQDRRQREFERREQEILAAALELCSRPDWESVTVEQIAAAADVGKGTVYKHFASKDELLFRLMIDFYHGLLRELREDLVEGSPREQVRHILDKALRHHLEHREYRYVVEYCDRVDFKERAEAAWRDSFLEMDRAFAEWGNPIIEAGMDQGEFRRRPVREVMIGIHACFKGSIKMLWAGHAWCPLSGGDDLAMLNAATDFMLAGLTGEP